MRHAICLFRFVKMSEEESVLDNVQEHLNEDEGQSPQSKQSMSMYGYVVK